MSNCLCVAYNARFFWEDFVTKGDAGESVSSVKGYPMVVDSLYA